MLSVLTVTFVVLLVALGVKTGHDSAIAQAEATSRTQPTPTPTPTAPIVAVVGDGLTVASRTATTVWTSAAATSLGVQIVSAAVDDSGYVAAGSGSATGSFVEQASRVSSAAKLVVFFGGGADAGESSGAIESAASAAVTAARAAAPHATIVFVGPAWSSVTAPGALGDARDAIYHAAVTDGAKWIDPIAAGWLAKSGLVDTTGTHPTAAGEQVIATEMTAALKPFLAAAQ